MNGRPEITVDFIYAKRHLIQFECTALKKNSLKLHDSMQTTIDSQTFHISTFKTSNLLLNVCYSIHMTKICIQMEILLVILLRVLHNKDFAAGTAYIQMY